MLSTTLRKRVLLLSSYHPLVRVKKVTEWSQCLKYVLKASHCFGGYGSKIDLVAKLKKLIIVAENKINYTSISKLPGVMKTQFRESRGKKGNFSSQVLAKASL